MAQIAMGRKKVEQPQNQGIGQLIGTIGGAAIGTALAPGPGTAAGAALGGASLGGAIGGAAESYARKGEGKEPNQAPPIEPTGAVSRRLQSLQNDNLSQLRESINALRDAPPEVRVQASQPLLTAYMMEMKKRTGQG